MACGRAVIAAAVGGLLETVVAGTTGTVVPARDSAKFVVAAKALLADETTRTQMGVAARARAVETYDWRRVGDRIVEVYTTVRSQNLSNRVSLTLGH